VFLLGKPFAFVNLFAEPRVSYDARKDIEG